MYNRQDNVSIFIYTYIIYLCICICVRINGSFIWMRKERERTKLVTKLKIRASPFSFRQNRQNLIRRLWNNLLMKRGFLWENLDARMTPVLRYTFSYAIISIELTVNTS